FSRKRKSRHADWGWGRGSSRSATLPNSNPHSPRLLARARGVLVPSSFLVTHSILIAELARKSRLPVLAWTSTLAKSGTLISFGASTLVQYIDAKLPRDAVLRSGKPATVYYYTGRTSISRYRRPSELEGDILGLFRASGVGYILMDHVNRSSYLLAEELKVHC